MFHNQITDKYNDIIKILHIMITNQHIFDIEMILLARDTVTWCNESVNLSLSKIERSC